MCMGCPLDAVPIAKLTGVAGVFVPIGGMSVGDTPPSRHRRRTVLDAGNALADAGKTLLCCIRVFPPGQTCADKACLNSGFGGIEPLRLGWWRQKGGPWKIEVVGWILGPSDSIANEWRGFAIRGEISELMDAVWVRLPAPAFSWHGPLFAHRSLRAGRHALRLSRLRDPGQTRVFRSIPSR